MIRTFTFKGLLTNNGWIENAIVTLNPDGTTKSIEKGTEISGEYFDGYALPGFQNAHSHAFQYAMAGLAELHIGTGIPDDFWCWRYAMYSLALTLSPEQMEAIATMLYAEMARHGYTEVAEFHYLHHDKDGNPYPNLAEMGERLMIAAQKAGINITLVPMFYQQGGFGQEPGEKQKRFISKTVEDYYRLLEATESVSRKYPNIKVGIGIHSLRAVKPEDVIRICKDLDGTKPFHIHVSEQLKEIEDSVAFHGKRPVQWLLDNCEVNNNYHLVHATHLDDNEIRGIAESGANVVICPSTEGNLGDGLFPFAAYKNFDGKWSMGTDSHIGLNPFEELRILDYGQRLISHKRNTFFTSQNGDSGFNAIEMAWKSGKKAMGKPNAAFFEIGQPFDAIIMKAKSPLTASASAKNLCNTFVYASDVSDVLGTIANGNWIVQNGKHQDHDNIYDNFTKVMAELQTRM